MKAEETFDWTIDIHMKDGDFVYELSEEELDEGEVRFTGGGAGSDVELTEEEVRTAMQKYINMDEFVCESEDSHEIIGGRSYRWRYVPVEYAAVQK